MYDVIIVGAGIGGLISAAKLSKSGKKVLVLEKIHHIGGTSYVFKRKGYTFPMGPLSFSFPNLVKKIIEEIGIDEIISFKRNNFQLIAPEIDLIYSLEWRKFEEKLLSLFPKDKDGILTFFNELNKVINAIKGIQIWHPEFMIGKKREKAQKELEKYKKQLEIIQNFDKVSSKDFLDKFIENDSLKRLLGTQGTDVPVMSMVHLAFMWNVMSIEGIWFPSCGIHGINDFLSETIKKHGGEIKLRSPVQEILIEKNTAIGVRTEDGQIYHSEWIICNADYKKVFLDLINPHNLSQEFLENVKNTPYTGSELCVYLGINPEKVDLSKLRANHVFYRAIIEDNLKKEPENFDNKEIEICVWSNKSPSFTPQGRKSIILRVNMLYNHFERWRTGEKQRKEDYKDYKQNLAKKLIKTVEKILPGLESSIEVMEIATPLTYRDWGQRTNGSVAGWGRDIKKIRIDTKLLVDKPIDRLLMVGIYSVLEPFLGGFPVSIYTGNLAADYILE